MEGSVYIILNILDSLPVQYPVHFFQHHTELRLFISLEFIVLKNLVIVSLNICDLFAELTFHVPDLLNRNVKFQLLIKQWWRLR